MKHSPITLSRTLLAAPFAILALLFLSSCGKKDTSTEKEEPIQSHEENIVTLTEANLKNVTIKTTPVTLGDLEVTLDAAGRVSENLNETAKVVSTLEGRLIKLNCDLNDRVKTGDVLALVQTPELLGKALEVKAPINGVITERKSTQGELIAKDTEIYTISEPSDLWVLAAVKERDIGLIKVGQDVTFTVLAYPDDKFRGKVALIGNRVEESSRTLEVRIAVSNTDGRLKPGMFADVQIVTTIQQNVLLVPDTALQTTGEDEIVFVALSDTRFEKRTIKTGRRQDGSVEVLDGLKAGENVVTEGSFILKSELLKGELQDND